MNSHRAGGVTYRSYGLLPVQGACAAELDALASDVPDDYVS